VRTIFVIPEPFDDVLVGELRVLLAPFDVVLVQVLAGFNLKEDE
jgi:hypothetical protein